MKDKKKKTLVLNNKNSALIHIYISRHFNGDDLMMDNQKYFFYL